MTKPAIESNIFVLSDKAEHERNKIERLSKSQWLTDYALDIFISMKESESRRRPLYLTATQLHHRPKLVQFCKIITRTYKLSRCALHLSIYYLDRLIDFYTIRPDKLQLVAMICVHIAAQIENVEALVPRYSDLNSLVRNCYTPFEFKAVERKVLTFFEFELMRPTTASFVELFSCSFLTRDDYAAYNIKMDKQPVGTVEYPRFKCFEQMLTSFAQLLLRISDYTLSINRFSNNLPSLVAASCIAAVRQLSGVPKRWTPYLTELTSYTEQMVEPFVNILTVYHCYQRTGDIRTVPCQALDNSGSTRDSGYESTLSTSQLEDVPVVSFHTLSTQGQNASKQTTNLKRHRTDQHGPQAYKFLKLDHDQQQT